MRILHKHIPVLESGVRGSTTTFAAREIGEVRITWENEAYLSLREFPNKFRIVIPSISMRDETSVAGAEANAPQAWADGGGGGLFEVSRLSRRSGFSGEVLLSSPIRGSGSQVSFAIPTAKTVHDQGKVQPVTQSPANPLSPVTPVLLLAAFQSAPTSSNLQAWRLLAVA